MPGCRLAKFLICIIISATLPTAFATNLSPTATDGAENNAASVSWASIEAQAQGQTVYWNAWGGSPTVNRYIRWVAEQVASRYDIELIHVKLDDAATAVSRVLAEKSAGNLTHGSVDLIWLNGENFAAMRDNDLLYGPFTQQLPHFSLTNPQDNPEITTDFTRPTEGFESPWGKAQLTFYYDSQRVSSPPRSMTALLDWASANPGRFSYPRIPDFLGTTFLKQTLISLVDDPAVLTHPVDEQSVDAITAPLWDYLDTLHPLLWRGGRHFPASGPELKQLMGDGELSLAFTFNPSEPAATVTAYQLPPSTRSLILEGGTLGNVHFVAIPFNARHQAGALVVANFLLSPDAQTRKQDTTVWGDPTVLDSQQLNATQQAALLNTAEHPAQLPATALEQVLPEPHPSWTRVLEKGWITRYGSR
ncbi:ABC transporter substrate-binding protein [Halomonas halocynthiae]|uniref:ABC transporter substrate-binding protein n=1 Tax=Halomonas halocynthiae TaxID=176290 RepID=UPI000408EC30|nr:ABC transporter substrate-binding protein [Halomonas halocynthiae]